MNRRAYASILAVVSGCLAFGLLTGCGSSSSKTQTPVIAITAKSGSGQSATVSTAFAAPLVATVTTNGTPTSGATVTFTAPSSGASCTLSSTTATTDASGNASVTCIANATAGAYNVTATTTGATMPASFSLTNTAAPVVAITATSGSGQSAAAGTAFAAPLVATVTTNGTPTSGVTVVFTAPSSSASGTFANGTNTETGTTDSSGVATSSTFTANATTGAYSVSATTSGATTPATFSLTNTAVPTVTYAYYLSGLEAPNTGNSSTLSYYALAGAVLIDPDGTVVSGEQDYNDATGITSGAGLGTPDTITGGMLTVDVSTGQGTLTLNTSNQMVGVSGAETLGVQFVNANHALIVQFDGSATSSGSLDLQTIAAPSGNYAFTLSGVDSSSFPIAAGGVFTVSGSSITSGVFDFNDGGTVATGTAFTGSLSAPDAFGRGTITGTGIANVTTLAYYSVGPEAIRIIDVDPTDSAVGSAFGQGTGTFDSTSLGASVFGIQGNPWGFWYAAAGSFTTDGAGTFTGEGEDDLEGTVGVAAAIAGQYTVASNGYGLFQANGGGLPGIVNLGVYMTDPTLNLLDPNNPTGGGGALLLDWDSNLAGGTGIVIPQTDTSTTSFAGNYAFGAQEFNDVGALGPEFDFVGQGSVDSSTGGFSGTGLVSDPFEFFATTPMGYTAVPFAGTAAPDPTNVGRLTMSSTPPSAPLAINPTGTALDFTVAIYQANGGQLFWIDEDANSLFVGTLEQQGSLAGMPAARKPVPGTQVKHKR